jgi:hypothetical protein
MLQNFALVVANRSSICYLAFLTTLLPEHNSAIYWYDILV